MSKQNEESGGRVPWVLLVEDEDEIADILNEGLQKAGYRVVRAANVGEANAKLRQQKFDCIVTDLVLGRGDGSQVIAGVRSSRSINSQSPIILMSGHLSIEIVKQLRPMINSVLLKPFDLKTLITRISTLVANPSMALSQAA